MKPCVLKFEFCSLDFKSLSTILAFIVNIQLHFQMSALVVIGKEIFQTQILLKVLE